MTSIKFERIKLLAECEFLHRNQCGYGYSGSDASFLAMLEAIHGQKFADPRVILDQWIDYGVKLIRNWDVRCVAKLIELFPGCIPTKYKGMSITVGYDEKDDWAVCFGTPA